MRGKAYGEFDHVVWATMTEEGPILANLFLDCIWDENVVTEEMVDLVRNKPFPVRIEPIYLEEMAPEKMSATVKATNDTDTKMHVTLTGQSHDELFYQLEQTSFVVQPNDVATFKLNLKNVAKETLQDLSTLKVNAEITYEFEEKPNVSFSSLLNFKPFFKNTIVENSKVKLDGNLKEWKNADWIAVENVEGAPFDFDGTDDLSLKFATAYDAENLYVAVDLIDNNFMISEEGSHWNQDGIILGLDARPKHQSAFSAGQGRGRDWLAYLRTFKKENPVYGENRLPTNVSTEVKMTETGATMEIAIPLEYINKVSGGNWSSVRFGLGYYDYDTQDENATIHFWFPAWNGADDIPGSGILFKE